MLEITVELQFSHRTLVLTRFPVAMYTFFQKYAKTLFDLLFVDILIKSILFRVTIISFYNGGVWSCYLPKNFPRLNHRCATSSFRQYSPAQQNCVDDGRPVTG